MSVHTPPPVAFEVLRRSGLVSAVALLGLMPLLASARVAPAANQVRPLLVGSQIPPVTVQTPEGKARDLAEVVSEKPTLLVFYRGGWCPFCNKHLSELAGIEDEIERLGMQIVGVSADVPADAAETLKEAELPYTVYADPDFSASQALGIAFYLDDKTVEAYQRYGIPLKTGPDGSPAMPVPAVFLIDGAGTIVFAHVNPDYRERLDGSVALAAARDLRKRIDEAGRD